MISLDRLLDGLAVEVEPFALCEVHGTQLELGCQEDVTLHYVLAGTGHVHVDGWPDIPIADGTVLIVPRFARHRISSPRRDSGKPTHCAAVDIDQVRNPIISDDAHLLVACGRIDASYQGLKGLFDLLPEPLVERMEDRDPVRVALGGILEEFGSPQPGSRAVVRALMQQCLILLLRRHCARTPGRVPWLSALQDTRVWEAARAVFEHPEAEHSVEGLAARANMSRSAFAEHFSRAFGCGPITLAKELRLRNGAHLLATTDTPVKRIAEQIGYASRSYFSRSFQGQFGCAPSAYREEVQNSLAAAQSAASNARQS